MARQKELDLYYMKVSFFPLKFWAEAINCSTQVSNVTPRKGKEKIPLEIWTGNRPKLNYLKKFGCVAYFHVPKVLRNKFEVPGRRGIMLGYARERRGYRIYDIKNQKVLDERSVKFKESLKGSNYLGEIENETWDIDSFFEVSPERNEINQNTKNGVLSNFDINNVSVEIENDNSIPLQTMSSPQTGRIQLLVLELNDVQNQIPVRRSERLKSKQKPVHLTNNVPNSYFEVKNSAYWQNWKLAMENELDLLDKHKNPNLRENQLVLLKDPNTRPLDWPMGRILVVFSGNDGLVRVVNVKTSTGILKRAITKVVPLPIPDDPAAVEQTI
ncbi:retrovirus-related Pol polyprotein from transposon TNT 1-94 [Trichonephila clavipes]|nr:retrovirus-related Pol polyprotein from transposon TNT 1-94 [Trichonephila clavipes]